MANPGTYFIDTTDFSTATAVFTNPSLTVKASDGYYVFNGNYRQQEGGFLSNLNDCNDAYYSFIEVPLFLENPNGGYTTCVYFTDPYAPYSRETLYSYTFDLQIGDAVYYDQTLTEQVIPILDFYFPYYQGTTQKWVRVSTTGLIDQVGYCGQF